jgi:hypothetical protein
VILDLAEFAPDRPLLEGASDRVFNVLPATPKTYGPWRSTSDYSSALTARAQGALAVQDKSGNANIFAGDASKLYRLLGSTTFSDVSKVGGYTTGASERWSFTQFGERIIGTNYTDPPQSFVMGTSALFADLITTGTTSLKARYVATVRDWVVFFNTQDVSDGVRPQRVWWAAIDDPTEVPTPGSGTAREKQSDFQDVVGPHGWGMQIVGNLANTDAALFFERAVYRMDYVGPPAIFTIKIAEGVRGCPAPGSVVQIGNVCYFLGEDGFYRFDGASATPIGKTRVDEFFFDDVDLSKLHLVSAAVDPQRPIVYWAYPRAGVSYCNRIFAYNWVLDRWSATDVDSVQVQLLLQSLTIGTTVDTIGGLVDSYPQSVDDRQFTGGRLALGCFTTANKLAYFSGSTLAVSVDTAEANLVDGWVSKISGARVITDAASPTLSVGGRFNTTSSHTFGAAQAPNALGLIPAHVSARYHKGRIAIAGGSSWRRLRGIEIPKEQINRESRQ